MDRSRLFVLLLLCLLPSLAIAQVRIEDKPSDDPVIEQRLADLSHELRCLQCQNQTLADSPSDLAADMRREIREQMKAGKSDQEIIAFLSDRYGQFILYKPRVRPLTYLLWFGPFVLLVAGLAVLFRYIRNRRDAIAEEPLTNEERRRAEELLRS
jgi:cytochrome c-type biogenesis protein CcmH